MGAIDLRRRVSILRLLALSTCMLGLALHSAASEPSASSQSARIHSLYAGLLAQYTEGTDGTVQTRVNYRGLGNEPRWTQLVNWVAQTDPGKLDSRDERLAYWINVYNIFAIDLILGAYPVDGIKDIGSFFSPVWKHAAGKIHGRVYTLDEIEHEILRPMGEPRIHSAIVCASISCPALARTPFEADKIDRQLEAILVSFLANPRKGARLDRGSATLRLSKIFDWFESDFERAGGVLAFVLPRLAEDDARWIRARRADLQIEYFDYDWGLNK